MKKATGNLVANFLRENIICRFGVPSKIISENLTIELHVFYVLKTHVNFMPIGCYLLFDP